MWKKIPDNILRDIHTLNSYTAQSNKESTLTACSRSDKIFTAGAGGGDDGSVESMSCDTRFGETKRIMDHHTHPYHPSAVGLLPSQADLAVTLSESKINNRKQISCISNAQSPLIACQQVKRVPSQQRINEYVSHEIDSGNFYDSEFHRKNVPRDFNMAYFDPKTGQRVQPSDDQLVQTMLGASVPVLKEENSKKENEKLCRYMKSISGGKKSVAKKCIETLTNSDPQ